MKFEWDEAKRRSNLTRHGFDFERAEKVFAGVIDTVADDRFDYGERRFITLGLIRDEVVTIAHTLDEEGKVVRIISIRKATKNEEIAFFEKIWD